MKRSVLLQEQGGEPADPLAPGASDATREPAAENTGAAREAAAILAEDEDPGARVGRIDGQDVVVTPADEANHIDKWEFMAHLRWEFDLGKTGVVAQ